MTAPPLHRYQGVLFDLLTGLLDSWSLWNAVAGDAAAGHRWRTDYLQRTYRTGGYRPYEDLVAEAAEAVGLPRQVAGALAERYGELRPWPGVVEVLQELAARSIPLGLVTNCSERLGRVAAACTGMEFASLVTAERAGAYKPDPRPYRLGLQDLTLEPAQCLFVAGSAFDLIGTEKVGLPTFWHDRAGMKMPPGIPSPLLHERSLDRLSTLFGPR